MNVQKKFEKKLNLNGETLEVMKNFCYLGAVVDQSFLGPES